MALKHLALPVKLAFKNKEIIAPDVYAFNFVPSSPLGWKAGQHGFFEIPLINGKTGRRPFSISSAPSEGVVTFTTRITTDHASEFKKSLLKLKKGTEIKLRGPIGPLHITPGETKYALLATGIGITPFRAILKELSLAKAENKITLFYVGNKDNHFYREDLSDARSALPNFSIEYIYKPERITGHVIEDCLGPEIADTVFFLSGSSKMVKSYRRTLQGLGVPRKRIKNDTFFRLKPAGSTKQKVDAKK